MSLDLRESRTIREKAALWTGRVVTLHPSQQNATILFLVGTPPLEAHKELLEAADDALAILHENLEGEAEVITEERSDMLADKIVHDLAHAA